MVTPGENMSDIGSDEKQEGRGGKFRWQIIGSFFTSREMFL
jgi:hypothetical protein